MEGNWFFSPSAWQLLFVLGFVLGGPQGYAKLSPRVKRVLFVLAGLQTVLGAAIALGDFTPDPTELPEPKLFFLFDKTYLSPARIVHVLALSCFFAGAFASLQRFAAPLTNFLALLGRNSLNVFCAGSLLSLCGQVARYAFEGRWEIDWLVLLLGLIGLGVTAWLTEWRQRHGGGRARAPVSSPSSP